jgi:hypothetical protein
MWFFSCLRKRPSNHAPRCRPQLETLEDRWLPSTLSVTSTADNGSSGTLRYEIAAAHSGDTIDLSAISGQTINLSSELLLTKNLTIQVAAGDAPVTILGTRSRVFEIDRAKTTVALNNLNISDGDGVGGGGTAPYGEGGAIWNAGILTLNNCILSNNSAALQGGADAGGAIYNAGSLRVNNCILDDNTAGFHDPTGVFGDSPGDGGAIYNAGSLTVNNCILDDNTAIGVGFVGGDGSGIFNASNATASVMGSSLSGNGTFLLSTDVIYNDGAMTLSGSTVTGNNAAGIFNDSVRERHGHQSIGYLTIQSQSSVVGNSIFVDLYNLGSVSISTDSTVGVIGP